MKYLIIIINFIVLFVSASVFAASESMEKMPSISAKRSYIIKNKENGEVLMQNRGFGEKEQEVRMMNLMMVEGASVNGEAKRTLGPSHYQYDLQFPSGQAKLGKNTLIFFVRDNKTNEVQAGLKFKALVSMTTMNMGSTVMTVTEVAPGKYQVQPQFSMAGTWELTLESSKDEKSFNFDIKN